MVSEVEPRRGSPFLSPCHPGLRFSYLSSPTWSGISLPFPLSPRPKVGEPAEPRPGISFNKSFPRCVSSLENRFTSFDCSLGKHTSRSKNKRWFWHTSAFSGKNIYYRSEQLQQAETLVTVSPCEFPPRCHPRLGRGSPCPSHCHPGLRLVSLPNHAGVTRTAPFSPHFTASSFGIPQKII